MDGDGIAVPTFELRRTFMDMCGQQAHGLQNRLRGAAEASWVGSIPIHPRQISSVMTAKMTATSAHARGAHRPILDV